MPQCNVSPDVVQEAAESGYRLTVEPALPQGYPWLVNPARSLIIVSAAAGDVTARAREALANIPTN